MKHSLPHARLWNFVKLPWYLEQVFIFGALLCADSFLFVLTTLPIRVAWNCAVLRFSSRQMFDLLRLTIMVLVGVFVLQFHLLNVSFLYHWIRGQSPFKLYVIFNILGIVDLLLCAFGEDAIDTLQMELENFVPENYCSVCR